MPLKWNDEARAEIAEMKERWQLSVNEHAAAMRREAEARLREVMEALKPAKRSIEAIMQGRTAIAAIALSGVGDDIDKALAAAHPKEGSRG